MASQSSNPLVYRVLKYLMPVLVLLTAWLVSWYFLSNKPEPEKRASSVQVLSVEAIRLNPTEYPVVIRSQGTVRPTYENSVVPEVAGTVVWVSPDFVAGGSIEKDQVLLRIDARDYEIAVTQSKANLAQTQAQLLEQSALAERAEAEWKAMGRNGQPSALTLRKPQLAAAEAAKAAAAAELDRARLDLQRTQIKAPYKGMVLESEVNEGQYAVRGSAIGQIYSVDSVDVRLPLSNRQLSYLTVPAPDTQIRPQVQLQALIGNAPQYWTGQLIRVEGLDASTQQLNLIAQVQHPLTQGETPLRAGQFVQAQIEGDVLEQVFVIPRSALREEREVLLIDDQQQIQRQPVVVAWSDDKHAAIEKGLEDGALLITTPLSTVSNGTTVEATIDGVPLKKPANKQPSAQERSIN